MSDLSGPKPDNNSGESNSSFELKSDAGIAHQIQESIHTLFERFVSADGLTLDHKALLASAEYACYEQETQQLADFNPVMLEPREERLAFWVNIYNAAVLTMAGDRGEVPVNEARNDEAKELFQRSICTVGGQDYSLNDIEYGILRGNARQPNRAWRHWRYWDPRLRAAVRPSEPRVCFALIRPSRSWPALRFFDASQIEGQLYQAATGFIRNGGVVVDRESNSLSLAHIFRDYSADFGGGQGVIRFVADHLETDDAAAVRSRAGRLKIKYHEP